MMDAANKNGWNWLRERLAGIWPHRKPQPTATGGWRGLRWGGSAKWRRELGQRFGAARAEFQSVEVELERQFSLIGAQLEGVTTASERLLAGTEALAKLAGGEFSERPLLGTALGEVQGNLSQLAAQGERLEEFTHSLVRLLARIEQARRPEAVLRSAVAPLRSIKTLFRVSAAGLTDEARGTYSALAMEIDQLNDQVERLLASQFRSLAEFHECVSILIRRLVVSGGTQRETAERDAKLMQARLDEMQTALHRSKDQQRRLSEAGTACHAEVARVVMAMQFQDITRQKLDHVSEALERLAEGLVATGPLAVADGDLNTLARVQRAQLSAVEAELANAEAAMAGAIHELSQRAAGIIQTGCELRSWPTLGGEADTVGGLQASLARIEPLVQASLQLREEARALLDPLVGLAANLTGAMRDVSLRIKLIALNAQIQAVQHGGRTGLEVLSQRTCQISDEVDQLSRAAAVELDALLADFREVNTGCGELLREATEQANWCATAGKELQAELAAFRAAGGARLDEVAAHGAALQDRLRALAAHLDFHTATAGLTPVCQCLEELEAELPAAETSPASGEFTQALQSRYTMASEHAVLATALAAPGSNAAPPVAAPAPAGGTVELF